MRKTLIGCMVATALATVSSAHAQVFSYSFTDTNKAVRNIKPATQTYLNPAGVLTLNLISGLDRWICPYISRHLLSLNPLLACCRRYSRG
ncbi:hypothetical protein NA539_17785, partial [Salmonella sp. NW465]